MKLFRLLSLFISAFLVLPAATQVEGAPANKARGLGVNLTFATYWSPQYAFNNLLMYQHLGQIKRTERSYSTIITMEKLMWFSTLTVVADAPLREVRLVGTEVQEWKSDREVVLRVLKRPDPYNGGSYGQHGIFYVKWHREQPVTDLKVLVDADRPDALYNQAFLNSLERVSVLRMMDWAQTNHSPHGNWAARPKPFDPFRDQSTVGSGGGIPLEWMVELANQIDADLWYCVPHKATDEYIRESAKLLGEQLAPQQQIYVELSNEVWNGIFKQAAYAKQQGKRYLPKAEPWAAGQAWYAHRSHDVFRSYKEILGERVTTVLATQTGNWGVLKKALENYPDRSFETVDAIGCTLYWGGNVPNTPESREALRTRGKDYLLDFTRKNLEGTLRKLERWSEFARQTNAKMIAYEAGLSVHGNALGELSAEELRQWIDFTTSEELLTDYQRLVKAARAGGVELINWYADCGVHSPKGSWGHQLNPVMPFPRWRVLEESL